MRIQCVPEGVALVLLRDGAREAPIFFFPGAGGDASELAGLATRLRTTSIILSLDYWKRADGPTFSTVTEMARQSILTIRGIQPRGPYRLVGYSFGGLVAFEVAHALKHESELVAFLGLIDTDFATRYWPANVFFRTHIRRALWHLCILARKPPKEALAEFWCRTRRLAERLARRWAKPTSSIVNTVSKSLVEICVGATEKYRPMRYNGRLTLFNAREGAGRVAISGCDLASLWHNLSVERKCWIIPGAHRTIVRDASSLDELVAAMNSALVERH